MRMNGTCDKANIMLYMLDSRLKNKTVAVTNSLNLSVIDHMIQTTSRDDLFKSYENRWSWSRSHWIFFSSIEQLKIINSSFLLLNCVKKNLIKIFQKKKCKQLEMKWKIKTQIVLMKRTHTYHSLRYFSTPNLFSDSIKLKKLYLFFRLFVACVCAYLC